MKQAKNEAGATITIMKIATEKRAYCVRGMTPLIMNRLSRKTQKQLLLPPPKKTQAERSVTLKHNPLEEFLAAPHRLPDGKTLLAMPTTAFKSAMRETALRLPGSSKKEIGQLCYIRGDMIPVWGIPKLLMSPVRSADMNKTPDIRTRVILPHWCAVVTIEYIVPQLSGASIDNLFAGAGQIMGIGDWRPEKGSGDYGTFELVGEDDTDFKAIMKAGGRKAQLAAMDAAEPYDAESQELLDFFNREIVRRGDQKKLASSKPAQSRPGNGAHVGDANFHQIGHSQDA
jgi:hypothetical protein